METKVPFYNVVNILLPGLVLIGSCVLLFLDEVKDLVDKVISIGSAGLEVLVTVSLFAIAYEVGYVMFRLGSAIIEKLIIRKLTKMFPWTPYPKFIDAEKTSNEAEEKLETLSREYAFARTQIVMFILLTFMAVVRIIMTCNFALWVLVGICVACILLFTVTVKDHMEKIQNAVERYLTASTTENEGCANG